MEDQAAGKAMIHERVIAPLMAQGMRKPKRLSVEDHAAVLDRIAARLWYLSADQADALAEVIARNAGGALRNVWPDEVSVMNWAALIEPPPASDSRFVRSYMASRAGVSALEEGPAVAMSLLKHCKEAGRPPNAFEWERLRDRAREWDRARLRAEEGGDRAVLDRFAESEARARALVHPGQSEAAL